MIQNDLPQEQNMQQNGAQRQQRVEQQMICRICIEEMSAQQTFTVCLCKGANGYVHQRCLTQWAKKAPKYRQSFDNYYYNCEICKDKIYLKVYKQKRCLTLGQIRFMGDEFCCTLSSAAILLLALCLFSVSLYLMLRIDNSFRLLFEIVLGFAIFIILLDVVLSVVYFFVKTDIAVIGIVIIRKYIGRKQTIQKVQNKRIMSQNTNDLKKQHQSTAIMLSKHSQVLNASQTNLLNEITVNNTLFVEVEMIEQLPVDNVLNQQLQETHELRQSQPKQMSNNHTHVTITQNINNNNEQVQQSNEYQQLISSRLFFQEPTLQESSLASAQEHMSSIIQVKSKVCYIENQQCDQMISGASSIYKDENDIVNQQNQLENNISHISSNINASTLQKHRSSKPRNFRKLKKNETLIIGENNHYCGNQTDDVEIFFPRNNLKKKGNSQNKTPNLINKSKQIKQMFIKNLYINLLYLSLQRSTLNDFSIIFIILFIFRSKKQFIIKNKQIFLGTTYLTQMFDFIIKKNMIEQSQKNSTSEQHQHDNIKIYHKKCSKYLYQDRIIQLIEQYLQVKSNIFELCIDNINIDENLTKKCCPDLKISSVFNKLKDYCLNCQKLISQFPQNQRKEYLNDKISFCLKCFLDIQRAKNIDQSKKTQRQLLLKNIILHCKKQYKNKEEKENEEHQQHEQQFLKAQTINEKELMRQYSHKNDKIDDQEALLSKMSKPQLIEKILAMTLQLRGAHEQTKKYKDQIQKNSKLIKELQYQNKMLQNKTEFSFQQCNSITLLNTSKNSSCVESLFSKDQSKIQSEIYNINQNQNFSKQNSDDQNTLFHPQKIEQAQKIQLPNVDNSQYSSRLSIVSEQNSEDDRSNTGKPITRSERKSNSISVLNQNQYKTHINMTTPVKGLTKKQSSKDSAAIEPVNVPIMIKNANNNN